MSNSVDEFSRERIDKYLEVENHEKEIARWLLENHELIVEVLAQHRFSSSKIADELSNLIKKHEELCK